MTGEIPELKKISRNQAEVIARLFNVTMNSAILYGSTHPTTLKNIISLYDGISVVLNQYESVSLIINREELYIEEWPVNGTINPRRLIQQFSRIGIISVTFFHGLQSENLVTFISMAGDIRNKISDQVIENMLQKKQITAIKINYVRYGKIISDQQPDNTGKFDALIKSDVNQEKNFYVAQTLPPEKQLVYKNAITSAIIDDESSDGAIRIIEDLKGDITFNQPQKLTALLDTLYEIKISLEEAVEAQKITGKVISAAVPVSSKINELTCETILKLVKEEYSNGAISIKRLAQIIRRMLPDLNELKQILPKLKELFISEGMPLADYLSLVRMLDIEIDSEAVADSLCSAADKIGVTMAELMNAIKTEPDDAARLILLASEIRQGNRSDELQLSRFLTEYIEKISSELALQSAGLDEEHGGNALRKIISQIEVRLYNQLNESGIRTNVLQSVKKGLSENLETVFDSATKDWLVSLCTSNVNRDPAELALKISAFIDQQAQLPRIQDSLAKSLLSKGYNPENVKRILSNLSTNGISASNIKTVLPNSALSANNMLFLLNREINQHKRYGTPFTTMIYTIENVKRDSRARNASESEKKYLLPQLFGIVKKHLREIDLLGTAGIPDECSLLSIMTMTKPDGAQIVKQRITGSLQQHKFDLKGTRVCIEVAISITAPDKENTMEFKDYLNAAKMNHKLSCEVFIP